MKKIIEWLGSANTASTTERFLASENFKLKEDGGICSYLGDRFRSWFLAGEGKVEDPISDGRLRYGRLAWASVDGPILEELGNEAQAETTLTELFGLMSSDECLPTDSSISIFYIRDLSGMLCAVSMFWEDDGWSLDAHSVKNPCEWDDGVLVFSREYPTSVDAAA